MFTLGDVDITANSIVIKIYYNDLIITVSNMGKTETKIRYPKKTNYSS